MTIGATRIEEEKIGGKLLAQNNYLEESKNNGNSI